MNTSGNSGTGTLGRNSNGDQQGSNGGNWEQENDFDDLISALRSGDVFGKDIDKMRRKKKPTMENSVERERVPGSHKYA